MLKLATKNEKNPVFNVFFCFPVEVSMKTLCHSVNFMLSNRATGDMPSEELPFHW